jgi:2,4-dienoyl-CoA reductase-like NADH-dependent reductase (Old Yellow Enzyme family)
VLIDWLVEHGVDYIHASLMDALNAKPVDSQDGKELIELVVNRVNGRVPLIVAGFLRSPDDVAKAMEYGPSMVALGQALVMNPTFVEMLANEQEDQIATVLKISNQKELLIPENLLNVAKLVPG